MAGSVPALTQLFAGWARHYRTAIVPGSLREPAKGGRFYNTAIAFSADGKELARYRKIHLFQATLPDRKYREADYAAAGKELCVFDCKGFRIGLAICYDLRFPELFRGLRGQGAQAVLLPSAFTVPTGKAHWESLLRARAIENQIYLAAPALTGTSGNGAKTYGHSLAIDSWGKILRQLRREPGLVSFELSKAEIQGCASKVDSWASRRRDLFPLD
ncbi:carbon-nitrogen hydrolase family protein [bacterium]|nr:carbon-nitrogen hydrolase family protein [bacterium]